MPDWFNAKMAHYKLRAQNSRDGNSDCDECACAALNVSRTQLHYFRPPIREGKTGQTWSAAGPKFFQDRSKGILWAFPAARR